MQACLPSTHVSTLCDQLHTKECCEGMEEWYIEEEIFSFAIRTYLTITDADMVKALLSLVK